MAHGRWGRSLGQEASGSRNYESIFRDTVWEIDGAIQKAKSRSLNGLYSDVQVLCLSWSDSDPDVEYATDHLRRVFQTIHKFPTQKYHIENRSSTYAADTMVQVGQIVSKMQDPDSLLIVIYTGPMVHDVNLTGAQSVQLW